MKKKLIKEKVENNDLLFEDISDEEALPNIDELKKELSEEIKLGIDSVPELYNPKDRKKKKIISISNLRAIYKAGGSCVVM